MKFADYKSLLNLKRQYRDVSRIANETFAREGFIDAKRALNVALWSLGYTEPGFACTNEGTANAVLSWADQKTNPYR